MVEEGAEGYYQLVGEAQLRVLDACVVQLRADGLVRRVSVYIYLLSIEKRDS
jgi:hypothetical protein